MTTIVGMGNPILTDDAIGVRLAQDLHRRLGDRNGVTWVEECSVGGLNLLDIVGGCDRLVVLDSVKTPQARPGTWRHFTLVELRPTMNLANVHDTNFATAIELGRRLGIRLPPDEEIHVIGVEIVDNLTFGERLTPQLEDAYPALLEVITSELLKWLP